MPVAKTLSRTQRCEQHTLEAPMEPRRDAAATAAAAATINEIKTTTIYALNFIDKIQEQSRVS